MMWLSKLEARHLNCRLVAVISDRGSKVKHNSAVSQSEGRSGGGGSCLSLLKAF